MHCYACTLSHRIAIYYEYTILLIWGKASRSNEMGKRPTAWLRSSLVSFDKTLEKKASDFDRSIAQQSFGQDNWLYVITLKQLNAQS